MVKSFTRSSDLDTGTGAFRNLFRSPWTSWIGFRYLRSKTNSRFLSFISLISIVGVMLGVCAMIVVLSVMDGFENQLKKRLISTDLHILIAPKAEVVGFSQGFVPSTAMPVSVRDQIFEDHRIEGFWPVVSTEVILRARKKVAGVVFKGVSPERIERLQKQVEESAESLVRGSQAVDGIYVGRELADELQVLAGDEVSIVSPTETEGPMDSVPRLRKYRIVGIYASGLADQELHTVFAPDHLVRSFLRRADALSSWELTVKNFDEAPAIAQELSQKLPQYAIKDWVQMNSHLFFSLKLERVSMFVMLTFIVIVASFNIVTTLTLMVLEKKRDIAILKTIGARNGEVAAIFLAEGLLIGGLGVSGGIGLGWLLCTLQSRYGVIVLPEVYFDRTLPVSFDPLYYLIVAVSAFTIVLIACLYPSRRAADLNPLDGIRFG